MMTGFITIATLLVGTFLCEMTHLFTLLALNFIQILRFLPLEHACHDMGIYGAIMGPMTFTIAIGTKEFGFFGTTCAEMTGFFTTPTSNCSQEFRS